MLGDGETIRHSGDVVRDGSCSAGGAILRLEGRDVLPRGPRQQAGIRGEGVEERLDDTRGLQRHTVHAIVSVQVRAQKTLELQVAIVRYFADADECRAGLTHVVNAGWRAFVYGLLRRLDQIEHLAIDHSSDDFMNHPPSGQVRPQRGYFLVRFAEALDALQVVQADEACAQAVVDVVMVVGYLVGDVRNLRLEPRFFAIQEAFAEGTEGGGVGTRAVLQDAFPGFEAQIETGERGVLLLEHIHDAQRLKIVFESAMLAHALVERILTGVTERRVAEIVRERDGLAEILVETAIEWVRRVRNISPS